MTNETMQQVQMTEQELRQWQAYQAEQARRVAQDKRQADIIAYKEIAEELVDKYYPRLRRISEIMAKIKSDVYRDFGELIKTKGELFDLKQGQRSHTYRNKEKSRRITLGYYVKDAWDDTADVGISMVKRYISSLASGNETNAALVGMILDLLAKDGQGNLQASKVLELDKYATQSGDTEFIEGVNIIKKSYIPELSSQFVRVEHKDSTNKWVSIPLSITDVGNIKAQKK